MLTRAFWRASLERAIKSAAQGLLVFWAIGDGLLNAFDINWQDTLGVTIGMFLLSVVTSLASQVGTKRHGPSLSNSEQVVEVIRE